MKRVLYATTATAVSATLFHFGTGLRPVPCLAFLAPLPVLLYAPRGSARMASVAAFTAWLAGQVQMWGYFTETLGQPLPVALVFVVGSAVLFALLVVVARELMQRRWPVLAALS